MARNLVCSFAEFLYTLHSHNLQSLTDQNNNFYSSCPNFLTFSGSSYTMKKVFKTLNETHPQKIYDIGWQIMTEKMSHSTGEPQGHKVDAHSI